MKRGPKPKPRRTACIVCGGPIVCGRDLRQTCSDDCRKTLIRRKRANQKIRTVMHVCTCTMCDKSYTMTGTEYGRSRRKTCGKSCEGKLRSQAKTGVVMPPESVAIISQKRSAHPNTGPFASHFLAKNYRLRSPTGEEYYGQNLALFVREYPDFADPKSAYFGLSRLRPGRQGAKKSWRGWTWIDEN